MTTSTLSPLDFEDLVRHVEMLRRQNMQGRERPEGWRYDGPHGFLLEHGRRFESAPLPEDGMRVVRAAVGRRALPVRQCFFNAATAALADKTGRLRYCEGYAFRLIPVNHAWLLLDDRYVVDVTWNRETGELSSNLRDKILGTFRPDEAAYFGVAFSRERLRESARRTKSWCSLLFDWMSDFPLMSQPFDESVG